MSRRAHMLAVACLLATAALAVPSARAAFTAPVLVSTSPSLQADYAYSPAISADGRYVAWVGSVASVTGVYRKDLQSGRLEVVARGDASAPSISADGRYVSFTTSQEPATGAAAADECASVYVRDMLHREAGPAAFTLASARDGSGASLRYAGSGKPGCPGGGAAAADRVALSANGRRVAFTAIGESDLTEAAGVTKTPPDQVAVRDLATQRTTLVSTTLASQRSGTPQPVPLGGALAGAETPLEGDDSHHPISGSTAAISADGSTVAWMGVNLPEQVPVGPPGAGVKEQYGYVEARNLDRYAEPLWRRIANGPTAPTERILAEYDPANPNVDGPLNFSWDPMDIQGSYSGPLYGSYVVQTGFDSKASFQNAERTPGFASITPQLSADGRTVALLCTAPVYGSEPVYPAKQPSRVAANVFLVNMASGLNRAQALRPLTAWASTDFDADAPGASPIDDVTISPDGTRVAFTTIRTLFPLAPPELITPPVTSASFAQLYEADLRSNTLALVSQGYDGSPANGPVYTPVFDGDGNTLAFASSAHDLVYGAANPGGSNVFAISAITTPETVGVQSVAAAPADPPGAPEWRLSATARSGPRGSVVLDVAVPGAGSLSARASAASPLTMGAGSGVAVRGARRTKGAKQSKRAKRRAATTQLLASAQTQVRAAGLVELRLTPAGRYRSLLRSRGGLYAAIAVSFVAPGRKRLSETLHVDFREATVAKRRRRG